MKLRIAYFCKRCDEEVDLEKTSKTGICPHCGYTRGVFSNSLIYEWKVEDKEVGKRVELPEGFGNDIV